MQHIFGEIVIPERKSVNQFLQECKREGIPVSSSSEMLSSDPGEFYAYFHVNDAVHYTLLQKIADKFATAYHFVDSAESLISGIQSGYNTGWQYCELYLT